MLQGLDIHVRSCLERAAEARRRAEATHDPELKVEFFSLEKQWTCLAKSYELAGRIENFLLSQSAATRSEWQVVATAPFGLDLELAVFKANDA